VLSANYIATPSWQETFENRSAAEGCSFISISVYCISSKEILPVNKSLPKITRIVSANTRCFEHFQKKKATNGQNFHSSQIFKELLPCFSKNGNLYLASDPFSNMGNVVADRIPFKKRDWLIVQIMDCDPKFADILEKPFLFKLWASGCLVSMANRADNGSYLIGFRKAHFLFYFDDSVSAAILASRPLSIREVGAHHSS